MDTKKIKKTVALLTISAFMCTPFYGLVNAAQSNSQTSISSIEFDVKDTIEVEVEADDSGIVLASAEKTVSFQVTKGDSAEKLTDYVLQLRNEATKQDYVVDGGVGTAVLPEGTYTLSFLSLPDGTVNEQASGAKTTVVIDASSQNVSITLNEAFGKAKTVMLTAKANDGTSNYSVPVGNCTYAIEKADGDTYKFINTFHTDSSGVVSTQLNNGHYRVTLQDVPSQYTLSQSKESKITDDNNVLTAIFYMESSSTPVSVEYTVLANSAPYTGAIVTVIPKNGNAAITDVTDHDGKVSLSLIPGSYTLNVVNGLDAGANVTRDLEVTTAVNSDIDLGTLPASTQQNITIKAADDLTGTLKGYVEKSGTGEKVIGFYGKAATGVKLPLAAGDYVARLLNTNDITGGGTVSTFSVTNADTAAIVTVGALDKNSTGARTLTLSMHDSVSGAAIKNGVITLTDAYGSSREISFINESEKSVNITNNSYTLAVTTAASGYEASTTTYTVNSGNTDAVMEIPVVPETASVTPLQISVVNGSFQPVGNAVFEFTKSGSNQTHEFTSNSSGDLTGELPTGNYVISLVSAPSIQNAYMEDVNYTHKDPAESINLQLQQVVTYPVSFRTINEAGLPVSDVAVMITPNGVSGADANKKQVVTNAEGSATKNLEPGSYKASLMSIPTGYTGADMVEFTVGESAENSVQMVLKSEPTYDLTVSVKDNNGNVVPNCTFMASEKASGKVYSDETDTSGKIIFELPEGTYEVRNTANPDGVSFMSAKTIDLTEDSVLEFFTEHASSDSMVNVTLSFKDKDGVGINGVVVGFYKERTLLALPFSTASEPDYVATSDSDGVANVKLPVGKYTAKILYAPKGYQFPDFSKEFEVTLDGNVDLGSTVSSGTGENTDTTGTMEIVVTYNGVSLSDVGIRITDSDGSTKDYTTGSSGLTVKKDEGSYKVTIIRVPDGYTLTGNASTTVELVAGGTAKVTYIMEKDAGSDQDNSNTAKGNLFVSVSFNGSLVSNIGFSLQDTNGNFITQGTTDSTGTLRFNSLTAGTYQLINTKVTDGYKLIAPKEVNIVENTTTPVQLNLSLQNPNEDEERPAEGYGAIIIYLEDKSGETISDAEFTVYSFDEVITSGFTDTNGRVTIKDLSPGEYDIVQTRKGSGKSLMLERKTVNITAGNTTECKLTLPNEKGHAISGFVFSDDNYNGIWESKKDSTCQGAKIRLLNEDGDLLLQTKTDADGEFKFSDIPDGDYIVKLLKVSDYDYISEKYGTNRDSSLINKRGEYKAYMDGEDIDDILMGIIEDDAELKPVLGDVTETNDTGRFPTLDASEQSIVESGNFVVDYNDSAQDLGGEASNDIVYTEPGKNVSSNMPKTGDNGYLGYSFLFAAFMFLVLSLVRRIAKR